MKPPSKRGAVGKAPQFRLFLCIYSRFVEAFQSLLFSPPTTPVPNKAPSLLGGY